MYKQFEKIEIAVFSILLIALIVGFAMCTGCDTPYSRYGGKSVRELVLSGDIEEYAAPGECISDGFDYACRSPAVIVKIPVEVIREVEVPVEVIREVEAPVEVIVETETIRYVEVAVPFEVIVYETIYETVFQDRIVEVPFAVIVNEVTTVFRDKKPDIEAIIALVLKQVEALVPDSVDEEEVKTVVEDVAETIIENTVFEETDRKTEVVEETPPSAEGGHDTEAPIVVPQLTYIVRLSHGAGFYSSDVEGNVVHISRHDGEIGLYEVQKGTIAGASIANGSLEIWVVPDTQPQKPEHFYDPNPDTEYEKEENCVHPDRAADITPILIHKWTEWELVDSDDEVATYDIVETHEDEVGSATWFEDHGSYKVSCKDFR